MQKDRQPDRNRAAVGIRKEIPTARLLEIAPRLSRMFDAAFTRTFSGTYGQDLSVLGPYSASDLWFTLFENRADLNGTAARRVPELGAFLYSKEFLGNVSGIAHQYGFRRLEGLRFLDVRNNAELEITDHISLDY